jgi:ABC-type amino acid transport system permease subunit
MALISFTYQPIPILIVAAAVYLAGNSVIVFGQYLLERRYGIAAQQG